jgi:transcriptional regulator with XRE-family HTH domain
MKDKDEQDLPLFTRRLRQLFRTVRDKQGKEYSPADVQAGTQNALTTSYIWRLLSGSATNPSYNVIKALADFFQVEPAYFFQDEAATMADSRKQHLLDEVAMRASHLDEDGIQRVVDILEHIDALRDSVRQAQDQNPAEPGANNS